MASASRSGGVGGRSLPLPGAREPRGCRSAWGLCHLPAGGLPGEARPGNRTCCCRPRPLPPPGAAVPTYLRALSPAVPTYLRALSPAVPTYLRALSPRGPHCPAGRSALSSRSSHLAGVCGSAGNPGNNTGVRSIVTRRAQRANGRAAARTAHLSSHAEEERSTRAAVPTERPAGGRAGAGDVQRCL
ncbi:hypothetical protein NN561_018980 [Cricetulus griseus]